MTLEPRVRLALDLGAATASAALIGPVDGRRRLLGAVALPAGVDEDILVGHLLDRVRAADPILAERLGLAASDAIPRLVARSAPAPILAVLATTVLERVAVERVAGRAGWRTRGASLDLDGPVGLTRAALESGIAAIAASGSPATSREETAALAELAAVVAGVAERSSAPPLILVGETARDDLAPRSPSPDADGPLYAPAPDLGQPAGEPLRHLLDRLDPTAPTPRRAALAALLDLAFVLDRRIELVEVGFGGGLRAMADPDGLIAPAAIVPAAALVPPDLEDDGVDEVLAWSTVALDRHRMRDRLRELRSQPWVEAHGDGARLRVAAARAAVTRLVLATRWLDDLAAPDLILVAGGAWAAAPGPAIALAIADVVRRPGASALAVDGARLLGPIGMLPDAAERRALLAEIADDLLTPLGSVIVPQRGCVLVRRWSADGRRSGGYDRAGPRPGWPQLVDLPPWPGRDGRAPLPRSGRAWRPRPPADRRGRWRARRAAGRSARCAAPAARSRRATAGHARGVAGGVLGGRRDMTDAVAEPIAALVADGRIGLELVPARRLLEPQPVVRFELTPGDRILVAPGDPVTAGLGLAERQRDSRLDDGPPVAQAR